jgi:hypothetical protein
MFTHRSSIRKVAVHLLLLWVLALGAGVVHACNTPSRIQPTDHIGEIVSGMADHHHAAAMADKDQPTDQIGKTTCLKFCDEVKAVSSLPDDGGDRSTTGSAPLWLVLRADLRPLGVALITACAQWQLDRPLLPAAVEYLRLAL